MSASISYTYSDTMSIYFIHIYFCVFGDMMKV